jgi:hypothetical protein
MIKILYCLLLLPIIAYAIGEETSAEWQETEKGMAEKIVKPKMDQALQKIEDEKKEKVRRHLEYRRKMEEEKKKAPTLKKRCLETTYYGINCLKEYRDNKRKKARRRYAP